MLNLIEKKSNNTTYNNCHSLAVVDHQTLKIVRKSLPILLQIISDNIEEGKWTDGDIMYIVPSGHEYQTKYVKRMKNEKFTATSNDGSDVTRKTGSLKPLIKWCRENFNMDNKFYLARVPTKDVVGE